MADAHELQHHRAHTDTSFAPPSSEPENDFRLSDRLRQQRYNTDSHARHHNAGGIDPFDSDDGRSPIGVSPNSTLSPVNHVAIEEVPRTPSVERSRLSIKNIGSGERSRDDDPQDTQFDAFSQIHLINQDTRSGSWACQARSTKDEFVPSEDCPTRRKIRSSRFTWLNVTMICICSVSTALSAMFVVLASKGQRYGDYIGNNPDATLSISAAILWTSIMAKTIELTFVTGFVAFLGQVLSRRALAESNSRGVTLSELTIWRWLVQPGTLVAQPEIARYTGMSALGILTLLGTILSTLYVTATTALVQPISQQSDWRARSMCGSVQTDFANINYMKQLCPTPDLDRQYGGSTCMQIDNAGKSYYNLAQYIGRWADTVKAGEIFPTTQEDRPAWIGIPYANTTVVPQWIDVIDTAEASRRYQRVINNVTLALPHVGVSNAARDQRNIMPQPELSDTIEAYSLWASVPSPAINVLCVHLNKTELQPLVYEAWPNNEVVNSTSWGSLPGIRDNATTKNRTVVDELFGWDLNDTTTLLWPPVFGKFPMPFNTILNHTSAVWGRSAIYLLGQGGPTEDDADLTGVYPLCKLQASISTRCSTLQSVSVSGSKAEALCEERASDMTFSNHASIEFVSSTTQRLANWRDVGSDWANSLSLGDGLMNGNNSLSRTLMMLALQPEDSNPMSMEVELNQRLPSLAETLAIGASDTLLTGLQSAPFVEFWNYTHPMLDEPQTQWFQSKIKSREYASGGVDDASKGWLVVLISTFLLNVVVLVYFIQQPGLVTDFSQPPQLFALALNSPPTRAFAGSCGGGPEGKEYKIYWSVGSEGGHAYIEPKSALVTDDSGFDRIPPHQDLNQESPKDDGFYRTMIAALSRMKPRWKSGTHRTGRRSTSTGAEPLRSSHTTQSVPSLGSQYELGSIETQTRQQHMSPFKSMAVP